MTTEEDKPEPEAKTDKDAKEPKANGARADTEKGEAADGAANGADEPGDDADGEAGEAKKAVDDERGEDGELVKAKAEKSDDEKKDGEPDLVPPGNPLRWKHGLVALTNDGIP